MKREDDRQHKIIQDKTTPDNIRHDKTIQHIQDKTKQRKTIQYNITHDKTIQDKTRQHHKTRQDNIIQKNAI